VRLFVALDLPPDVPLVSAVPLVPDVPYANDVRHKLTGLLVELKDQCPGVRWVRPENIHVTLKFIGHVDPAKVNNILHALETIHSDQPVEIEFRGMGFFPNDRRPRVVWCGVQGSPNLAKLAQDIEAALAPLGIERETRAYTPHLTLARIDPEKLSRAQLEKLLAAAKKFENTRFGEVREAEFRLYESVTKPSGAEYKILHSFSFVKGLA
jgi:RNA 2',3'-cyclic 3'-phosphodiesterase